MSPDLPDKLCPQGEPVNHSLTAQEEGKYSPAAHSNLPVLPHVKEERDTETLAKFTGGHRLTHRA